MQTTSSTNRGGKFFVIIVSTFAAYFAYSPSGQAQCREVCDAHANTGFGTIVLLQLQANAMYNTAVGDSAQQGNQTGTGNTAVGAFALDINTASSDNTAVGLRALYQNTASQNTAVGALALQSNSTGRYNSGFGYSVLSQNNGNDNTAAGWGALQNNTAGGSNTATGSQALFSNTSGSNNTSSGFNSLVFNTGGSNNVADGVSALQANTTGASNTGVGSYALYGNSSGNYNVASGFTTLYSNNGNYNTATGAQSLYNNNTGNDNTADGGQALISNTSGSFNTASGAQALYSNTVGHDNTSSGFNALFGNTTGSNNVALGSNAGQKLTTGSNNIVIGANVPGVAGESNAIRIGKSGIQQKTFIAGISGKTVASGTGVIINSQGQLGTVQSSARFKDDIRPMEKASEAVLKLKPVTFRYKEELDPDKVPQFGLIAEEVEKVSGDLIVRDEEGKPFTVRYDAINAMLLNEFLKQHRKLEQERADNEARFAEQRKEIALLIAELKAQRAKIDKVSAWVDLGKSYATAR